MVQPRRKLELETRAHPEAFPRGEPRILGVEFPHCLVRCRDVNYSTPTYATKKKKNKKGMWYEEFELLSQAHVFRKFSLR